MEPEDSLLCLQNPSFVLILSQINAVHVLTTRPFKIHFVLPYLIHQSLASGTLLSYFPTKTLYVFLFSPIRDTCSVQTSLLNARFQASSMKQMRGLQFLASLIYTCDISCRTIIWWI